jgi:hypothetical protein
MWCSASGQGRLEGCSPPQHADKDVWDQLWLPDTAAAGLPDTAALRRRRRRHRVLPPVAHTQTWSTCTNHQQRTLFWVLTAWLQAVDAAAADSAGDAAAADAGGSADAGAAASSQAAAGDAAAAAADKQPEQQQQQEEAEQAAAAASTTSSSAASSSSSTGEARGTGVFFTTGGKDGKPEVKTEMLIEPVPEVRPCPTAPALVCCWHLFVTPRLAALQNRTASM